MLYATGDTFDVCDPCSPFHEWEGSVIEVLDDGYYCMVIRFNGEYASITFGCFSESQMASKVYLTE